MWWIYVRGIIVGSNLLCLIEQIVSNQVSIASLSNLAIIIMFTVLTYRDVED